MERHFCVTTYVRKINEPEYLFIFHRKLGKWLPPGGHVDLNENPQEAAVRECLEETGLTVKLYGNTPNIEGGMLTPYGLQKNIISENKHEHFDIIYLGYPVEQNASLILNEQETTDLAWFKLNEIDSDDFNTFASVKYWCHYFAEIDLFI